MPEEAPLERQVFALSFQRPGAIEYFAENLPAMAVGLPTNQTGFHQFYVALVDFYNKTGLDPIEPIAFRSWLESETELYEALGGGPTFNAFLTAILGEELSTPESVTAILKYRMNKRRQLDFMQELQSLISKKGHKDEQDNERLVYLTEQIRSLEHDLGYSPLDAVDTAHTIAARAEGLFDIPDFIRTQYPSLNRALGYTDEGGFCKGAVHAIVAQSGMGKSTLAKCLVNFWADQGHTTLFINYEEARAHWERVLFTQITKHNVYLGASPMDQDRLTDAFREKMERWGDRFMVRHDPDTPYFDDLEQWLRDLIGHNERLPDIVVIDTIQSMFIRGSGGQPRWGQYEQMMVRLEKLAKDMNAVFIITAQENANRMKERREVAMQSDIGGSLAIVQKCAVVLVLAQKRIAANNDAIDETIMEIQIPKNRITGGSNSSLDPPMVKYNDRIKSYESFEAMDSKLYDPSTYVDVEEDLYN